MDTYRGKYGRWGHGPRCNCPDCSTAFLAHNRDRRCGCQDCDYHREIDAPAPPVTPPRHWSADEYENERRKTTEPTPKKWFRKAHTPTGGKTVSGLHMCERQGCNAIIKGDAVGLVDIMPNTNRETQRKGFELCPPCIEEVYTVLHSDPIGERQRAYDKPFRPGMRDDDTGPKPTAEQLAAQLFEMLMQQQQQREISATKHDENNG